MLFRSELSAAVAGGERRHVAVRPPLPVHVIYLTAWVDSDGSIAFRDDVYGEDSELAEALRDSAPANVLMTSMQLPDWRAGG